MKGLVIGRIVHYVCPNVTGGLGSITDWTNEDRNDLEHMAAIVTRVYGDRSVDLRVFPPGTGSLGAFMSVRYDDSAEPKIGTWHWPERVE